MTINKAVRAAVLSLLCLLAVVPAAAARPLDEVKKSGFLRVGVYRDFAPFSSGDSTALRGIDVDLGNAIAKRLGVRVQYLNLTSGEQVDDDLRNGVWKGHYLGYGVADVMLHIPYDKLLELRNDNVYLFAPYYREQLAVVMDPAQTGGSDLVTAFSDHKVGVEGDTLADTYLLSAFGGALREQVAHFRGVGDAVAAMRRGEIAGVMAPRSQIEGALGRNRGRYHLTSMPTPGLTISSWLIGMAVKVNAHDLAYAIEPVVQSMVQDGSLAKSFVKHGLTYVPPPKE